MRQTALKLLAYYGISVESLRSTESRFTDLRQNNRLVASIVTTGLQNPELLGLLSSGRFRLLDLDDGQIALKRPSFRPFVIRPEYYPPEARIPSSGVATIASTALLAVRVDASDRLVTETLNALYGGGPTTNLGDAIDEIPGRIGLDDAASWTTLPWHPAARQFFDARAKVPD
jgi:TRAP-type uncharacterized transport system substrate-binding protein